MSDVTLRLCEVIMCENVLGEKREGDTCVSVYTVVCVWGMEGSTNK